MLTGWLRSRWPLLIPAFGFFLLIVASGSALLMRKVVTFLLLPAGLVWMLLSFALFWPRLGRARRIYLGTVWLIYTLTGNPVVGNKLVHGLESPYAILPDPTEPFDVLIVLGGGTLLSPAGKPQLSAGGDRVMTAARLYKRGLARKLICGGRSVTEVTEDRDLSAETMAIWKELGVPEADMMAFSEPRTTEEEIRVYRDYLDSLPRKPARVGICTSAWHMARTEKLWRRLGIEAIPVPADFRSHPIPAIPMHMIPQRRGFSDTQIALWELAAQMGD